MDRLRAIASGQSIEALVHPDVQREPVVLQVHNFSLWYQKKQALANVTMPIPKGKVTALIGPSGCGKSTLLRSANRMNDLIEGVQVDGDMLLNGESIFAKDANILAIRRRMGMVFQKPNPFPASIFENVVYPLRIAGERNRKRLREACEQSLRDAALWEEVKDRLDENGLRLSGGQQQRLCIARAIVNRPEILLLDEPCSSLDPLATSKIEDLIQDLRGSYSILIVTHNMQQASRISDYTAFMYLGRLIEMGPTSTLFTKPKLRETEDYITGRFG
ncbi:MAG: phosphate ABC transporter ATP-binding protein PstB [Pirellulales bacterium]